MHSTSVGLLCLNYHLFLGLKKPEFIAFDWLARHVYVVDEGLHKIIACDSDGSICTDVVNVQKPHSLLLDPLKGYITLKAI